jgi:3-ketosteroid 9alpha-monooxygenase subunit B
MVREQRAYRLRVARVIDETDDACSVEFDVDGDDRDAFSYRPGQFLTLRVPSDRCGSVARCYSLSSSPHVDQRVKVTVKRTVDGYGSNWICDTLAVGDVIDALPPAGVFSPRSLDADLLLLAAGSGITPVVSIVKSALAAGAGRVVLIYANRDERGVIFAGELGMLAAEYPERLLVVHWLESLQGLPAVDQLAGLARPFATFDAFVCGPKPFMAAARAALAQLGVPRGQVKLERFQSLGANPFEQASPAPSTSRAAASVRVTLDGARHSFDWPGDTKLLDLLLDNGVDAPYSCREGACSACACRLVAGEVKMLNNDVLEDEDIADGIILACQSLPVTDAVEVSYE